MKITKKKLRILISEALSSEEKQMMQNTKDLKSLKNLFHRLSFKHHPDQSKLPDTGDNFKELNNFYNIRKKELQLKKSKSYEEERWNTPDEPWTDQWGNIHPGKSGTWPEPEQFEPVGDITGPAPILLEEAYKYIYKYILAFIDDRKSDLIEAELGVDENEAILEISTEFAIDHGIFLDSDSIEGILFDNFANALLDPKNLEDYGIDELDIGEYNNIKTIPTDIHQSFSLRLPGATILDIVEKALDNYIDLEMQKHYESPDVPYLHTGKQSDHPLKDDYNLYHGIDVEE